MKAIRKEISHITLGVDDIPRMESFYTALDFEVLRKSNDENHPFIMFEAGNIILALYPKTLLVQQSGVDISFKNNAILISLNVENKHDVDDFLLKLKNLKAEITREPFEPAWGGYCAYFRDVEGNLWEVVWHEQYQF